MKTFIKYTLLSIFFTYPVFAQQIDIIPQLGMSITSRLDKKPEMSKEILPMAGITPGVGLIFSYHPNPTFALESGAFYGSRAYGYKNETVGFSGEWYYLFHELEIPVSLRVFITSWFNIGIGGFYSKYTGLVTIQSRGDAERHGNYSDSYERFHLGRTNYGMLYQLGFIAPLGNSKLTLDLNYRPGSNDIARDYMIPNDHVAYIGHLELYLGIRIPTSSPQTPSDDFSVEPVDREEGN